MACDENDELFLNDIWTYYFHDPYDNNWNFDSYINIGTVSTVREFWKYQQRLADKFQNGMFFIMREHIFPCWDDEHNREGGCLSIKILKQDLELFWESVSMRLLGETILLPDFREVNWDQVNGISTSPKKHFCIVKIWLKSDVINDSKMFRLPLTHHGDILYKSNNESIINNNVSVKPEPVETI